MEKSTKSYTINAFERYFFYMKSPETFYLTTTLPYVNSDPHIGFALEIVNADTIARYQRLLGKEVVFNTGTDEHGLKIFRKAEEQGVSPQEYVDEYAARFEKLKEALNLSYTNFIRTTDSNHKIAAQEFWKKCDANGDIYKKQYSIKYCVGCELEKTDSELVEGRCPLHPNLEIEIIQEENYFFRFSKYQAQLLALYADKENSFVIPEFRMHEIVSFVSGGLEDFSISRLKEKMPWGVPVPGDETQVMYVWFDALINYVSTLSWTDNKENFEKFWGTEENTKAVQFAGKDNLRQQSAMWQAMLMSAGLPASRHIVIHGFITSDGQKMSKSLGNVVDPFEIVEKYGTDALRYYLNREISTFEDGDFSWEKFNEAYTANLVNGIGNLTSRILKMAENANLSITDKLQELENRDVLQTSNPEYAQYLNSFEIKKAADFVFFKISALDLFIQQHEPFKKIKVLETEQQAKEDILFLLEELYMIARLVEPFMPETAKKISEALRVGSLVSQLFPRLT